MQDLSHRKTTKTTTKRYSTKRNKNVIWINATKVTAERCCRLQFTWDTDKCFKAVDPMGYPLIFLKIFLKTELAAIALHVISVGRCCKMEDVMKRTILSFVAFAWVVNAHGGLTIPVPRNNYGNQNPANWQVF